MEGVVDTLKTTTVGFSGFWVTMMAWLPDLVSLGVGILTMIYLTVKIGNELIKKRNGLK